MRSPTPRLGLPSARFRERSEKVAARLGCRADCFLLKPRDIPRLVEQGYLDGGLAPDEWVGETCALIESVSPCHWLTTKLAAFAVASDVDFSARLLGAEVIIATPFPRTVREWLTGMGCNAPILSVSGSTEALVPQVATIGVDIVETGRTVQRHGLAIVAVVRSGMALSWISAPHCVRQVKSAVRWAADNGDA